MYGYAEKINNRLNEFITVYIKPITDNSQVLIEFKEIRDSKVLNKLLFNNMGTLDQLFWRGKLGKPTFTLISAHAMFSSINDANYLY